MPSPELSCQIEPQAWSQFTLEGGAILVVGHGTRNPSGAIQLHDLVSQMQSKAPSAVIAGCFLELAEPSIENAIERLREQSVRKILVVPVLLFTAAHAKEDIPDAAAAAALPAGIEILGQTTSLGTHPSVRDLSRRRYQEVTDLQRMQTCPAGACARVQCESGRCEGQGVSMGRIGLAMVGRGTSEQAALDHMRRLTELRVSDGSTSVVVHETGFFAGGKPNVDALLDLAASWDCDTVIVQAHLLFEGDLIEQLRNKVLNRRDSYPGKQWFVSRTLGADPMLANVFLDLALEALFRREVSVRTDGQMHRNA